ncbi:hypothetical protein [Deinococcus altitudinis]|uniref:hypothetical protein n=1 Tax=Deinococcus altitudinis TaxID=468914 RepID=UPI00389195E1
MTSNSLHPGRVRPHFGRDLTGLSQIIFNLNSFSAITPEQGAQTSVYLATSADVASVTGTYFQNKRPRRANAAAYDEAAQERLWGWSEALVSKWLVP